MNSDDIKVLIETSIEGSVANVSSDDNVHFEAIVISDLFIEKSLIQRHQMVYSSLGEKMESEIHALSLTTLTPKENLE
ncbi:MAG: BolA family transcriptional regulator [Gammaproteobacteria bacterium]|nr:BolA family transcriptional regulator [Gammaproteobacteria bacterium]|tara:strand:- start:3820 stop:4053 length:234 start_codon:yes stop_codon:yes gene_type:complete